VPAGIGLSSRAVTRYRRFAFVVVTVYVVLELETGIGADPATALVTRSSPGFPETLIVCASVDRATRSSDAVTTNALKTGRFVGI